MTKYFMFIYTFKVVPLLMDSISIGLRSMQGSWLLLLVAFILIVILSALFVSGKGGGGGGTGTFMPVLEGGAGGGGGGGGGGGKTGADVTIGGGGLKGMVLCASKTVDEALGDVLAAKLGSTTLDALRRFGGKGGAQRVWC